MAQAAWYHWASGDCSLQRRNQKVIEETPAPGLPERIREELTAAAVRLGQAAHYLSAGTVEFLFDAERGDWFFLEVNTRLQVEHGVTEEVTGIDLVEWMVRAAAGDTGFMDTPVPAPDGWSIQARLYAEDPMLDFRPASGTLTEAVFPACARVETWVESGSVVSPFYDPMLAKLIVHGPSREAALAALQAALAQTRLCGIETNLRWLSDVACNPDFVAGQVSTRLLETIEHHPRSVLVPFGRHRHQRAGSSGPNRLVGGGRAAIGADGCARLSPGQSIAGQCRRCRRAGSHRHRPGAGVQCRHAHLSDGRGFCRHTG